MNEFPETLAGFFMSEDRKNGSEEILEVPELSAQVESLPGIAFEALKESILEALRAALDVSFQDIILNAWSTFDELQALADPERAPPDKVFVKPLAKHRIESEHSPRLEILLDNNKVGEIKIDIVLAAELEGFILKVKAGRVLEIRTGALTAEGKVSLLGKQVMERASEPYTLPGRMALDPPFAIPRLN